MSALPIPEQPPNKQMDPVSRFKVDYASALDGAQVAVLHTETEGWQGLYANHTKEMRDQRQRIAKQLRELADTAERLGLGENDEKDLGDLKKFSVEARAAETHWQQQTVSRVKAPVLRCQEMLVDAMREAQRLEENEPLTNIGLVNIMREAVGGCIRVVWDDETGRATVQSPTA